MLSLAQLQAIKANIVPKDTRAKMVYVYNSLGTILMAKYNTVNAFQLASGLNGSDIKKMIGLGLL